MRAYIVERLRIGPRPPGEREVEDARKALRQGADILRQEGLPTPSLKAIVWRLLQDAVETLGRMPDRERAWLTSAARSAWPAVWHTPQEQFEAEVHRLTDLKMSKEEAPLPKLAITDPSAPGRMLIVLGWLKYVQSRNPVRDKGVVMDLARGIGPSKVRHRYFRADSSESSVSWVKQRSVAQIEAALMAMKIRY